MAKKATPGAPKYANGREADRLTRKGPTPAEVNQANREYWSDAPGHAEVRLSDAQQAAAKLHKRVQKLEPCAERDERRQAGTRKGRRPEINDWITTELARAPTSKSPELWDRAPDWLTDQIGQDRFRKRVTACRKSRRK